MTGRVARGSLVLAALAGCTEGLDQRLAIIDRPRVLAVIAEPAEARPGELVTFRAVVATPAGPLDAAPRWSYCTGPKPPTEDNAVATSCVTGDALLALGQAPTVTAPVPSDACLRFGPDTPPGAFRPRDPDPTGGFYQPIRADIEALLAFGMARITCRLGSAPVEVARDYDLRYVTNHNPTFEVAVAEAGSAGSGAPLRVAAGAAVPLSATWPADAAEPYLYYDQLAQVLIERREALRVSWFATGGALDVDATAVAERDPATVATTTWHTPAPGPATLWFVLRDSRGGLAVRTLAVLVE